MKKMKSFALSVMSLTCATLIHSTAFADEFEDGKTTCDRWIMDYDDVHCVYVTGLDSNVNAGRYIKHYDREEDISYTRCISLDIVEDYISQDWAEYFTGDHNIEYSICTDAKADQCEPISIDSYTITKRGEKYSGTPTTYALDLSTIKDKYPACKGFNPDLTHAVKHAFSNKKR